MKGERANAPGLPLWNKRCKDFRQPVSFKVAHGRNPRQPRRHHRCRHHPGWHRWPLLHAELLAMIVSIYRALSDWFDWLASGRRKRAKRCRF